MWCFKQLGLGVALLCNVPMCVLPMRDIVLQLAQDWSVGSGGSSSGSLGSSSGSSSRSGGDVEMSGGSKAAARTELTTVVFPSIPSYDAVDNGHGHSSSSSPGFNGGRAGSSSSSSNAWCASASAAAGQVLLTLLLLVVPFGVATGCPGVEVVWGLCGSSVGVLLALTFPAGIYLKLRAHKVRSARGGAAVASFNAQGAASWVCACVAAVSWQGLTFDFGRLDDPSPAKAARRKPPSNGGSSGGGHGSNGAAPEVSRGGQGLLGGGVRMGSTAVLLLASVAILVACTWASLAAASPGAAAAAKAADKTP
jgi:hypothetical protein